MPDSLERRQFRAAVLLPSRDRTRLDAATPMTSHYLCDLPAGP